MDVPPWEIREANFIYSCFVKGCPTKAYEHATMSKGNVGDSDA